MLETSSSYQSNELFSTDNSLKINEFAKLLKAYPTNFNQFFGYLRQPELGHCLQLLFRDCLEPFEHAFQKLIMLCPLLFVLFYILPLYRDLAYLLVLLSKLADQIIHFPSIPFVLFQYRFKQRSQNGILLFYWLRIGCWDLLSGDAIRVASFYQPDAWEHRLFVGFSCQHIRTEVFFEL